MAAFLAQAKRKLSSLLRWHGDADASDTQVRRAQRPAIALRHWRHPTPLARAIAAALALLARNAPRTVGARVWQKTAKHVQG